NAGNFEFVEVQSASGIDIVLKNPLTRNYTASGKVQVVRVPRYTNLNIFPGSTLTGNAWDGNMGGVIAVEVSVNTIITGTGNINAIGIGFRGGTFANNNTPVQESGYAVTSSTRGSGKGESIAG